MKRILFVDDEPLVLQGLQRLLRPLRPQWEMEFVEGAALALASVRHKPCDVIVSDMMMPEVNGAELLARVRLESPRTIRLVLSGHFEQQLAIQCVGVAHQFLSKPCEAASLRSTLSRVTALGFATRSESLLNIVGRLERLPSPPEIYSQLVEMLDDTASTNEGIGTLIGRDTALTAQLLKIVNSAFFGLAQRVSTLAEAVAYLGFETLKAVVLTAGMVEQSRINPASGYCVETAAQHCQRVGAAARVIAKTEQASRGLADECYIAGLLHDVGKLILAENLSSQFSEFMRAEREETQVDEDRIFGTTHGEIGSYLLGLWGLPHALVEAIRLHHTPSASTERKFSALTAVHVANHLVAHSQPGGRAGGRSLDHAYLASLGLADRIPVWQAAIDELLPAPARLS